MGCPRREQLLDSVRAMYQVYFSTEWVKSDVNSDKWFRQLGILGFQYLALMGRCSTVKSLNRIWAIINYDNEHRRAHYVTSKFLLSVDQIFGVMYLEPQLARYLSVKEITNYLSIHAYNTCRYFVDIWGYFL